MGEEQVGAAWRAALDEVLDPFFSFDYDDVPQDLPAMYALATAARRYGGTQRAGTQGVRGWRVTARAVGRSVDEARRIADRVASLEGASLVIGGVVASPLQFEAAQDPEPDSDRYSALSIWTFATWPNT